MLVESLLCLFVFLKSIWKVRLVHVEVTKERQCNPSCSRYIAAATAALPLATKFARRLLLSFSAHCPTVLLSVHLALETGVSRFLQHPCELSPVRKFSKLNGQNCNLTNKILHSQVWSRFRRMAQALSCVPQAETLLLMLSSSYLPSTTACLMQELFAKCMIKLLVSYIHYNSMQCNGTAW